GGLGNKEGFSRRPHGSAPGRTPASSSRENLPAIREEERTWAAGRLARIICGHPAETRAGNGTSEGCRNDALLVSGPRLENSRRRSRNERLRRKPAKLDRTLTAPAEDARDRRAPAGRERHRRADSRRRPRSICRGRFSVPSHRVFCRLSHDRIAGRSRGSLSGGFSPCVPKLRSVRLSDAARPVASQNRLQPRTQPTETPQPRAPDPSGTGRRTPHRGQGHGQRRRTRTAPSAVRALRPSPEGPRPPAAAPAPRRDAQVCRGARNARDRGGDGSTGEYGQDVAASGTGKIETG